MGMEFLPTHYSDEVWGGKKKYKEIKNPDNTVSFDDVTEYIVRENSFFGARDVNKINTAVNHILNQLNGGTDLYEEFNKYFETQRALFATTGNEKINTLVAELRENFNGEFGELLNALNPDSFGAEVLHKMNNAVMFLEKSGDLNNIHTTGFYKITNAVNQPRTVPQNGGMIVLQLGSGDVFQIYLAKKSGIHWRYGDRNKVIWGEWASFGKINNFQQLAIDSDQNMDFLTNSGTYPISATRDIELKKLGAQPSGSLLVMEAVRNDGKYLTQIFTDIVGKMFVRSYLINHWSNWKFVTEGINFEEIEDVFKHYREGGYVVENGKPGYTTLTVPQDGLYLFTITDDFTPNLILPLGEKNRLWVYKYEDSVQKTIKMFTDIGTVNYQNGVRVVFHKVFVRKCKKNEKIWIDVEHEDPVSSSGYRKINQNMTATMVQIGNFISDEEISNLKNNLNQTNDEISEIKNTIRHQGLNLHKNSEDIVKLFIESMHKGDVIKTSQISLKTCPLALRQALANLYPNGLNVNDEMTVQEFYEQVFLAITSSISKYCFDTRADADENLVNIEVLREEYKELRSQVEKHQVVLDTLSNELTKLIEG